jgi:hypothetical protein
MFSVQAQKQDIAWQFGYTAPYLTQSGATLGLASDIQAFTGNPDDKPHIVRRLQVLTQVGYFAQINVSQNLLLNPELVYRRNVMNKRFYLSSSLGLGYLLSFQKRAGILNLATGETKYQRDALQYFLPNLNLCFGLDPKKNLGYYFKVYYGRKISAEHTQAAFFGLATGIVFKFPSKH